MKLIRKVPAIAALTVLLALAGCGGSSDSHNAGTTSWQGTWKSTWGLLTMQQRGATVSGHYTYRNGHLTGRAQGATLAGKWAETGTGTGSFHFVMNKDGCTLTGSWDYSQIPGGGKWEGVRQTSACEGATP